VPSGNASDFLSAMAISPLRTQPEPQRFVPAREGESCTPWPAGY
jgi:hypothetical protein